MYSYCVISYNTTSHHLRHLFSVQTDKILYKLYNLQHTETKMALKEKKYKRNM